MANTKTYDVKTLATVAVIALLVGGVIGAFAVQSTGAAVNSGTKCVKQVVNGETVTVCSTKREISTKFNIAAEGAEGWQACTQHKGGEIYVAEYCAMMGYNTIASTETTPCYYGYVNNDRYQTGNSLVEYSGTDLGSGLALLKVLCAETER